MYEAWIFLVVTMVFAGPHPGYLTPAVDKMGPYATLAACQAALSEAPTHTPPGCVRSDEPLDLLLEDEVKRLDDIARAYSCGGMY